MPRLSAFASRERSSLASARIRCAAIEALEGRALLSTTIYDSNGFEPGTVPTTALDVTGGFTESAVEEAESGNRWFLGRFGRQVVPLTLSNLPAHAAVTVSFDLYVIQSWDGNAVDPETGSVVPTHGPDQWAFGLAGQPRVVKGTLSNSTVYDQSFPETAAETNTLGYTFNYPSSGTREANSVYHITRTISHTGGTLNLEFSGYPNQSITDESWGLDNVSVSVPSVDLVVDDTPEEAANPVVNETSPGAYVVVNDDDDDEKGVPDRDQAGVLADEDNLYRVDLNIADRYAFSTVELGIESSAEAVRIWASPARDELLAGDAGSSSVAWAASAAPATVWLEPIALVSPETPVVLVLQATPATGPTSQPTVDRSKVLPINPDMDARTIRDDGSTPNAAIADLEDAQEAFPGRGAFLPVNNDDDDYNGAPDNGQQDANRNPTEVRDENDLLPVVIRGIPEGGKLRLEYSLDKLRIFANPNRTQRIIGNAPWNAEAQDKVVYVEGLTPGKGEIAVHYTDPNGKDRKRVDVIDVHVFRWVGPLNVPQYGTYNYTVDKPRTPGLPATADWAEPIGGAVVDRLANSNASVRWGAGGEVGRARYQVNDDYIWGLEVNLVEVRVQSPGGGVAAFTPGTAAVNGPIEQNVNVGPSKMIYSSAGGLDQGLTSRASVTLIGPLRHGVLRGVREMRVGFSQNVVFTQLEARYDGIANARVSKLKGPTIRLDGNPDGGKPYYNTQEPKSVFFNAVGLPNQNSKLMEAFDTPSLGIPTLFDRTKAGQNELDSIYARMDFSLYVIATTSDTRNGAASVFVREAEATGGWHWTVNQNLGPAATNFQFTPNAANRVVPPTGWTPVADSSEEDETQPWALPLYRDGRHWLP